jgi:hypothetical protein
MLSAIKKTKRSMVLAHDINGSRSLACKLRTGLIARIISACMIIPKKQTIENPWNTSDAMSTGRSTRGFVSDRSVRGNQMRPNEVK